MWLDFEEAHTDQHVTSLLRGKQNMLLMLVTQYTVTYGDIH